jgi:hypothetical protein
MEQWNRHEKNRPGQVFSVISALYAIGTVERVSIHLYIENILSNNPYSGLASRARAHVYMYVFACSYLFHLVILNIKYRKTRGLRWNRQMGRAWNRERSYLFH